jgi:hypothetical protein
VGSIERSGRLLWGGVGLQQTQSVGGDDDDALTLPPDPYLLPSVLIDPTPLLTHQTHTRRIDSTGVQAAPDRTTMDPYYQQQQGYYQQQQQPAYGQQQQAAYGQPQQQAAYGQVSQCAWSLSLGWVRRRRLGWGWIDLNWLMGMGGVPRIGLGIESH